MSIRVSNPSELVPPQSLLQVCVLDGVQLAAKDATGTSDPFCELYLASNKSAKKQTRCIEFTLHPNWGEVFSFPIFQDAEELVVDCYDKDFLAKDFIGSFVIKADDYLGQKLVEETFTLIPRKKSDGPAGKIRMQIIHAKDSAAVEKELSVTKTEGPAPVWEGAMPAGATKREHVARELLQTEAVYVRDLSILCKRFLPHLRNKKLLREHEIQEIFSNIEEVFAMHEELLGELRAANSEDLNIILPIFARYIADRFSLYESCCSTRSVANLKMDSLRKQIPPLNDFVSMNRLEYRGLNVDTFLNRAFPRLLKYPLLYRELVSVIDQAKEPELYQVITTTQKDLKEITGRTNEKTLLHQQTYLLQSVHRTLEQIGEYQTFFRTDRPPRCFVYGAMVGYSPPGGDSIEGLIVHLVFFDDVALLACLNEESPRLYACYNLLGIRFEDAQTDEHGKHTMKIHGLGFTEVFHVGTVEEKQKILLVAGELQQRLFVHRMLVGAPSGAIPPEDEEGLNDKECQLRKLASKQRQQRIKCEDKAVKAATSLGETLASVELLNRQMI